mmetsp:Transcript_16753/g.47806  ORF Transcript_16753/g.47806 Transcript_16753/m.47806 type:complete len:567 (-) Transcript_16753:78-1778(-)
MPVDPVKLRRVADHNDQVTESIKAMSKQLEKLDPCKPAQTSVTAKSWALNVRELKVSLEEQRGLSKEMRESARIQDEQHGDSFRDKYRFLVGRLKADIRGFFTALQEFVDLPQDFSNQKTWDHCVFDMETDIKHLSAINAGDTCLVNVEPIVMLLNYRDKVISLLLAGMLFQTAVLHWDLKSERAYADGPMVQMAEQVVHIFSKTESLPCKYRLVPSDNLPAAMEPGPFTFQAKQKGERSGGSTTDTTAVQYRLLTALREMQSLDKGLRNLRSSLQVHIPDKLPSGKSSAMADLQREVSKWFDRCIRLEQELSNSKQMRQTGFEQEVEQLTARCAEKDQLTKQQITKVHKLESDVQGWKYELTNLRKEKMELAEKNAKMAKENLPAIDKLLEKSREAVERLSKDCEMLSKMFRLQGQERKKTVAQQEETSREMERVHGQLAEVRECIRLKEEQLERKETLYLRTMAARKCIHEAYLEERKKITEAEEQMRQREADWQEMLKVLEGRDSEIRQLQGDLHRARQRSKELRSQLAMCMRAFTKATGRNGRDLLANFALTPTLPLSKESD